MGRFTDGFYIYCCPCICHSITDMHMGSSSYSDLSGMDLVVMLSV